MNDAIKKLMSRYNMRILGESQKAMYKTPTYSWMLDEINQKNYYDNISYEIAYETFYTISITHSELEYLAQFLSDTEECIKRTGSPDYLHYLLEKQKREHQLREENPTLKAAYEKYETIKALVESGS